MNDSLMFFLSIFLGGVFGYPDPTDPVVILSTSAWVLGRYYIYPEIGKRQMSGFTIHSRYEFPFVFIPEDGWKIKMLFRKPTA